MDYTIGNLTILLISGLILLIYKHYQRAYKYWKNMGVPQLDPCFPFGDMYDTIFRKKNMGDKIKEIYDKMKGHRYVGLYFFSRKAFLPLDPVLIKDILNKDFQHFYDRGIYYNEKKDPLSAHLFSIAGPKWKHLRSKLTPAYSPGKLKYMFDTIVECGYAMTKKLVEIGESKKEVEIKEILARYTTDVIGSCAFGLECHCMTDPDAEFRLMGKRAFTQTIGDVLKIIIIRSFPPLAGILGIGVFCGTVTKFFNKVVRETIEYREKNNVTRPDFLQLLIQLKQNGQIEEDVPIESNKVTSGTTLTIEEAAAQAFIFFLAGFETTSTTISFALYEMAVNETIQERAREEIDKIFDKYQGLTYESVMEMHYLDTVIYETMRKYPPAPVFLRKCTKTYRVPNSNVVIEEGLSVLIPCYGLHRDPEYFPEPDFFDPNRFSEENKSKIWDCTYIPFGDGPRNCIGMRFAMIQAKIALALTLRNFQFGLSTKTKLPLKMETKGIILTPIGGLWLDLKPRPEYK
ncbi:probable cytochrome P450 6a14 [Diorhabda carinulata]|uniref:probable cytochrome P450 6a14 n=1 Tax=Diorhabda carinulata TaxID=1163345 RepID=UPI0025A2E8F1|nr:probable cytochrome P450 6a14 [Diorhabda carinulata]